MRVRMINEAEGSVDGINTRTFEAGKTYDVPTILGNTFVDDGDAEVVGRKPAQTDSGPGDEPEGEPEGSPGGEENGPDAGGDAPEADEVTMERTSENSNWYQFRKPDGELITELDDGEEEPIKKLGESNAEEKRLELNKQYGSDADT